MDPSSADYRWEDHGMVARSVEGQDNPDRNNSNAIDPNVFMDSTGQPWLNWGSFCCAPLDGVRLNKRDRTTGKPTDDPPKLINISSVGEGSFILKRGSFHYLFVSIGICCSGVNSTYHVVMGRSRSLEGPYLDKAGRNMNQGGYRLLLRDNERYPGVGHNGFYIERDTTFLVFHAYDRLRNEESALFIKPMFYDRDGWPTMDPSQAAASLGRRKEPAPEAIRTGHFYDYLGRRHVRDPGGRYPEARLATPVGPGRQTLQGRRGG